MVENERGGRSLSEEFHARKLSCCNRARVRGSRLGYCRVILEFTVQGSLRIIDL